MRSFPSTLAIVLAIFLGLVSPLIDDVASAGLNFFRRNNQPAHAHYATLSLGWGPGICVTSPVPCMKPARGFHIRGLWPAPQNGKQQEFCNSKDQFKMSNLSRDVRKNIDKYWFSLFSDDSESLLNQEWQRHGTCLEGGKRWGQKVYFGGAIDIMDSLPLIVTLGGSGISPGFVKGDAYASSDIISALKSLTNNKEVQIDCELDPNSESQPRQVLTGINFCFDKKMKYIDCPQQKPQCEKVYFRREY